MTVDDIFDCVCSDVPVTIVDSVCGEIYIDSLPAFAVLDSMEFQQVFSGCLVRSLRVGTCHGDLIISV